MPLALSTLAHTSRVVAALAFVPTVAVAQDVAAPARAFRGARAEVVVDAAYAAANTRARATLRDFVLTCRNAFDISEEAAAAVIDAAIPPAPVSDHSRGTLVVAVQPIASLEPACGRHADAATAAARGVRASLDNQTMPTPVVAVRLERAGRILTPLAVETLPLRVLSGAGLAATASTWVRVVLSLDDVAVLERVGAADLTVEALDADGRVLDRVTVPGGDLQGVWRERLAARASGASASPQAFRLPQPQDVRLRRADESFVAGALEASIVDAVTRLSGPGLNEADRLFGWAQIGVAFATVGDEPAARVAFAEALALEPCLDLAPSAPASARAALQGLPRPDSRCSSQSVGRTLLRAAVAPGFGRPDAKVSSIRSWAVVGVIVGSATMAVLQLNASDRQYREYLAWQYEPSETPAFDAVSRLFDGARSSQDAAVALRAVAIGTYATQLAWAAWSEHRLARRVARVGRYGGEVRPRAMGVMPLGRDGAPGLTVSVAW